SRTSRGRRWCLMVKCSRILRPIVPALPHWRGGKLGTREFDEPSQLINFLLNMKTMLLAILALFVSFGALAGEPAVSESAAETVTLNSGLVFREINYDARVSDDEARVAAEVSVESSSKLETSEVLFDGELALLPPKLPSPLRVERTGNQYK